MIFFKEMLKKCPNKNIFNSVEMFPMVEKEKKNEKKQYAIVK